ncbi:MAG: hypothetical protein IV107_03960 [Paucibacter sp.]|nr:hypothetical protein [Roseateles sp.]
MTELQSGADALKSLIRQIGEAANDDLANGPDEALSADVRDYKHLAELVLTGIARNLHQHPSKGHRQGFALAMADLFAMTHDGVAPGSDWNPLETTRAAMAAEATTAALMTRTQLCNDHPGGD